MCAGSWRSDEQFQGKKRPSGWTGTPPRVFLPTELQASLKTRIRTSGTKAANFGGWLKDAVKVMTPPMRRPGSVRARLPVFQSAMLIFGRIDDRRERPPSLPWLQEKGIRGRTPCAFAIVETIRGAGSSCKSNAARQRRYL